MCFNQYGAEGLLNRCRSRPFQQCEGRNQSKSHAFVGSGPAKNLRRVGRQEDHGAAWAIDVQGRGRHTRAGLELQGKGEIRGEGRQGEKGNGVPRERRVGHRLAFTHTPTAVMQLIQDFFSFR